MTTRNYEAMFILENNAASADFDGTAGKVDEILEKHGGTIVQKDKWDERKLAYEIKGQRRGTYYLVYMTADPASVSSMYEDLHLTEVVLRFMFIALDKPIEEHIATTEAERERLAEDSRRSSLGWGGGRRGARGAPRKRDDKPTGSAETGSAEGGDKPAEATTEAKADDSAPATSGEKPAGDDGAAGTPEKEAASKS